MYPASENGNLHQYSKGNIHCSCPMCAAKTGTKNGKGKLLGSLQKRKKNYPPGQLRVILGMIEAENEYNTDDVKEVIA